MKIYWIADKYNSGIGWFGAVAKANLQKENFKPDFALRMEFVDCIEPSFMNYSCRSSKYSIKNKSHQSLSASKKYVEKECEKLLNVNEI